MKTIGYAAHSATSPLAPMAFERRELLAGDVGIEILYCGVCHSDLHHVRSDWGKTVYPTVPGHEIVGRVVGTGAGVTRFAAGDHVAVGCLVDSCQSCEMCDAHEEQMCRNGATPTYGGPDRVSPGITKGGYSKYIVVREEFVLSIPAGLDVARAAPLLCAGITTYSPLKRWNVGPGSRVGVIGLGGLGHMAIKLADKLGAHVTVISRSDAKQADSMALGADAYLVSSDAEAMAASANGFDLIIDTIPSQHDVMPYMPLLDNSGTLVILGQVGPIDPINTFPLVFGRRQIAGSLIGGIAETQELLNLCAELDVLPDVEMIRMDEIDHAFDRMESADVRYRFVIDMASLEDA